MNDFYERYKCYDGINTDCLIHIPDISCYNYNYYIGFKRDSRSVNDLIFAESDDDNMTQYYIIDGDKSIYLGYELTSEDILHITDKKFI